jgi:hypothetical protein
VPADDDRLEPGWTGGVEALTDDGSPDDEVGRLAWELGLGRARVLSLVGLDDAADRWVNGAGGPHTALAEAAPATCVSCGFRVPLGGLLGQAFGVCGNESSPSDGHVVTMDHGCGAHSESGTVLSLAATGAPVLDSFGYDELAVDDTDVADDTDTDDTDGGVTAGPGPDRSEDVSDEADVLDVADVPDIDDRIDLDDAADFDDSADLNDAADVDEADVDEADVDEADVDEADVDDEADGTDDQLGHG